jgi:hypothetical protein
VSSLGDFKDGQKFGEVFRALNIDYPSEYFSTKCIPTINFKNACLLLEEKFGVAVEGDVTQKTG